MANYELIDETNGVRWVFVNFILYCVYIMDLNLYCSYKHIGWRIALMVSLCMCSTALVYRIWQEVYGPYYTVLSKYPHLKESKFVIMKSQLFTLNLMYCLLL